MTKSRWRMWSRVALEDVVAVHAVPSATTPVVTSLELRVVENSAREQLQATSLVCVVRSPLAYISARLYMIRSYVVQNLSARPNVIC